MQKFSKTKDGSEQQDSPSTGKDSSMKIQTAGDSPQGLQKPSDANFY